MNQRNPQHLFEP